MATFVASLKSKHRDMMTMDLIFAHVRYLHELNDKNALIFCGVILDGNAIMILRAESIDEATQLIEDDPLSKANYYAARTVVEVMAMNEENDFMLDTCVALIPVKEVH